MDHRVDRSSAGVLGDHSGGPTHGDPVARAPERRPLGSRAARANFRNRATVTVLQAFSVVLLLAVSLVLVALARSSMIERGEELGITGVIGFTPKQRLAVLMVEHALLSVGGAVLGAIVGSL